MPKGKNSKKPAPALVLLNDSGALIIDKQKLTAFQAHTAEQLALIYTTEHGNVVRRIFVGLALHGIKASLMHGEWQPWLKKHAKGLKYRQTAYMMKAAIAFIEKTSAAKTELHALVSGEASLKLNSKHAATQKVALAATAFVGELSWGEFLDKHGIKEKKKLGGNHPATDADNEPPAPLDEEQLYLVSRDEIGGALLRAETLLVKENRLQYLAGHPEEIRGVVESLRSLADKVEAAAKPILKKITP